MGRYRSARRDHSRRSSKQARRKRALSPSQDRYDRYDRHTHQSNKKHKNDRDRSSPKRTLHRSLKRKPHLSTKRTVHRVKEGRSRRRHISASSEQPRRRPASSYSVSSRSSSSSSSSSPQSGSSISPETRRRRKTAHFKYRVGEKIGHKYRVTKKLGTGTFGQVVEGRYNGRFYAIKIIKPVQKYINSAKTEKSIIQDLCQLDPKDQHHIVRYIESLYYCGHYCLIFERLGPSLYDITKKNNYKGFTPYHTHAFAKQLFESLKFMHHHGYTHTDLKPENILLSSQSLVSQQEKEKGRNESEPYFTPKHSKIKLIDFGGSTHKHESHSSIINTRQYRSPEVLLECCEWNQASDVWSLGCILVELATGELLFHVHNNVDHVYMMEKVSGRFPSWMTSKCCSEFERLFHSDGRINYQYGDRQVEDMEAVMDQKILTQLLAGQSQLIELIQLCLELDPKKRISCEKALRHPYFDHQP